MKINLLLYILFKNVPEQSGNNYDIICYIFLFGKFPEFLNDSTYFQKLLKASVCMKKNSREFQTFPETSMTIHFNF